MFRLSAHLLMDTRLLPPFGVSCLVLLDHRCVNVCLSFLGTDPEVGLLGHVARLFNLLSGFQGSCAVLRPQEQSAGAPAPPPHPVLGNASDFPPLS